MSDDRTPTLPEPEGELGKGRPFIESYWIERSGGQVSARVSIRLWHAKTGERTKAYVTNNYVRDLRARYDYTTMTFPDSDDKATHEVMDEIGGAVGVENYNRVRQAVKLALCLCWRELLDKLDKGKEV